MDGYVALEGDLTVVFHFDVDELYVPSALLGCGFETEEDGFTVRVEFPRDDGGFVRSWLDPRDSIKGFHGHPPDLVYAVHAIQVQVQLGRGLGDEGPGNAESALVRLARPPARAVVRGLLDWARVHDRQVWLLPPHMPPRELDSARLMDREGRLTHGYGDDGGVIVLHSPETAPRGITAEAVAKREVPGPESLLAEAAWAVWPTNPPDTRRAVLLAAIAVEVKTPQVLRDLADETSRRLLDLMLARHDEVPMSVKFQLNDLAAVVGGEALKAHDGRLSKAIAKLFELRNGVAHRGETPDVEEARAAVDSASRVFAWLDRQLERNSA